jgi:signal transduction histidine kinase
MLHTSTDKQGDKIYKEIKFIPVKDKEGKVFQVVIVIRDITEEKKKKEEINSLNRRLSDAVSQIKTKNEKLEQTLKRLKETQAQILQSEKMSSIGQLAAGVAHEINNPTGFVSSNLKTLSDYQDDIDGLIKLYRKFLGEIKETRSKEELAAPLKELADSIAEEEDRVDIDFILDDISDLIKESREGTHRIKKIVLDLKDFAHPGEDKLQMADINRNIESTLNIVWNELKYKANVSKDYGELPQVSCYPHQLNQVFMNFLVNAAQAIEKSGEINIVTKSVNSHVEISISDTGSGIPKENLQKIFDPFFTTKEVGKGTGLGLNVAYNIIQKHKGTIDVESEVGKGTKFTIRIPAGEDS